MGNIAIVIPSFEPDERLISLVNDLVKQEIGHIYIVNDGSGEQYNIVFDRLACTVKSSGGDILRHNVNRGKGRALKTAFQYILDNDESVQWVITADSDGQHSYDCIQRLIEASLKNSQCLILGIRSFDKDDIPWKSRFGNNLTEIVFRYVTGVHIKDTQTGLRAIPRSYLHELLSIKGERFEFEMRMLINAVDRMRVLEVPIQTIYDSKENHQTHFNPIKDSIRIYRILLERFAKFFLSSVSACLLDLAIFGVMCYFLKQKQPILYVAYSTFIARVISAIFNFLNNYKFVFNSDENFGMAAIKYFLLAIIQMSCSALLVTGLIRIWPKGIEVIYKMGVDTVLFFISYAIQQRLVYKK